MEEMTENGMRLKPCHVFLQHCHKLKSVLTVALLLLHASGTT